MVNDLTTSDREALLAMPDNDWFTFMDRWSSRVNRAQYRLDRLEKSGHLERRVSGEYPNLVSYYRKTSGGAV